MFTLRNADFHPVGSFSVSVSELSSKMVSTSRIYKMDKKEHVGNVTLSLELANPGGPW